MSIVSFAEKYLISARISKKRATGVSIKHVKNKETIVDIVTRNVTEQKVTFFEQRLICHELLPCKKHHTLQINWQ